MMKTEPIKIDDDIRRAVRRSELSHAAICRASAIDQGHLTRFMAGRAGLSISSTQRLVKALDLELIVRPKRPPQRGRPKGR